MNNFTIQLENLYLPSNESILRLEQSLNEGIDAVMGSMISSAPATLAPFAGFIQTLGMGTIGGASAGLTNLGLINLGGSVAAISIGLAGIGISLSFTLGMVILTLLGYVTRKFVMFIFNKFQNKKYSKLFDKLLNNIEFVKDVKALDINPKKLSSLDKEILKRLVKKYNYKF